MNEKLRNLAITPEEENEIKGNSASTLPLNPTAQGFSGAEIRKKLYMATCGETGSVLALMKKYFGSDKQVGELNTILEEIIKNIEDVKSAYVKSVDFNQSQFILEIIDQDNNKKEMFLPFNDVYAKLDQLNCDINYNRIGLLDVSEYDEDTGEITYIFNSSIIRNMEYNESDGLLTINANPIDWSCNNDGGVN